MGSDKETDQESSCDYSKMRDWAGPGTGRVLLTCSDGLWNGPKGNLQEDFNPISMQFIPFGKKQSDKEPVTVCTIYYCHVQNMTTRCYTELLL